ncbi:MAG: hypothetical protein LAT67_11450 [Balneolales bacterium]|nr:hypothetical protein [Balneolales bacterium]
MGLNTYVFIHLIGVLVVFMALGGTFVHALNGGTKKTNAWAKPLAAMHGAGLLVILVFGLLGLVSLGIKPSDFNLYVYIKLLIWLLLGAALVLPYKVQGSAKMLMFIVPVLGSVSAYIGLNYLMRM